MATLTPSSSTPNISFDFMRNNNNSNNLDCPFSSSSSTPFSYLTSKEDALTQKKIISGMNMNINPEDDVLGINKKASEDLEIGVFGAEKYFNGDMDSDHSPRLVSPLPIPEVSIERIFVNPKQSSKNSSETPSLRSESSWNSQSLLLQNRLEKRNKNKNNSSWSSSYLPEKKIIINSPKVSTKKSFLANLGCRCVCSNWNSVDVVDDKRRSSGLKKIKTQLSFSGDLRPEMKMNQQQQQEILEQRKSLEIFGSPLVEKRIIQKKFPWEYSSSSKTEEHGFSLKHEEEEEEEEDGSVTDISTDLFEIESLKGKAKPFLARQGSSDPDSPNGYAPSEVSIAWSVVTASVADFSVMSECATSPVRNWSFQIPRIPIMTKSNRETAPQRRKSSGGGLLLGCKSHKSVRVSGDSYTSVNRTPSYAPRFPVEANQPSMETRRKISSSSVSHTQSPFLYT